MDNQKFERLVTRLEVSALQHPGRYIFSVISIALLGFIILGVAIGFSILSIALLAALVAAVFLTGGKALLVVAKLGKLVILLALPAWAMIKSSFTLLFSRFPPPEGRALHAHEAPALYARIAELRQKMKGPRVHAVLITDELNAAIVQHPRFGLFGWEKNYLILGLPLLSVLNEDEALAVVAHEYGHLSGHHGRLGGFIYRFRSAWGRLQSLSEQWNDWGSRLIARMFRWYAPYFNAYTFVLARQNEYIADRSAMEIAGAQHAANALMRVKIAAHFEQEEFWPSIDRRIAHEAAPMQQRTQYWTQSVQTILDDDMRQRFLEKAARRETDHLDTHPSLRDRLAAMDMALKPEAALNLKPWPKNAAQIWLGSTLASISSEFDRRWQEDVTEKWQARHNYLRERHARLAALQAQQTLAPDEKWERINLLDELDSAADLQPLLSELLNETPDHMPARFRHGRLLLEAGDETGLAEIERVMQQEPDAILPGCEAAWHFYRERAPEKAAEYSKRWRERTEYLERIEKEMSSLPATATLAPAELDEAAQTAVANILRENGKYIKTAYVVRRVSKIDSQRYDHVLAFETTRWSLGDKGPGLVKRLAQYEYPMRFFIVHLGTAPYKRFRKSIKRLHIAPIAFR